MPKTSSQQSDIMESAQLSTCSCQDMPQKNVIEDCVYSLINFEMFITTCSHRKSLHALSIDMHFEILIQFLNMVVNFNNYHIHLAIYITDHTEYNLYLKHNKSQSCL